MSTISITSLSESAIKYQKDFQMLPFAVMSETLAALGIKLYPGIQNKDVISTLERKQGIAKPYTTSTSVTDGTPGKAVQATLEVEKAYASIKDNINNYKTIGIGSGDLIGSNQTKKHPLEKEILSMHTKTFSEDVLDALFHAERDDSGTGPLDLFDGYDKKIDDAITAGTVAAGKNNLYATGALNSSNTLTKLRDMYRSANYLLRKGNSVMHVPFDIFNYYCDLFQTLYGSVVQPDEFNRVTLHGSAGRCKLVANDYMGDGDRVLLTAVDNLHFGMNTVGDNDFVQVRGIYEDPNLVNFWIQGDYGTRVASFNEKLFLVNDGTPGTVQLSGDYS